MRYAQRTVRFAAFVLVGILFSVMFSQPGQAAWISHNLPEEVVIGDDYHNIRVNLSTEEEWSWVSSGTLYWGNPVVQTGRELDRVTKQPFLENRTANLADGYELFFFDFTVTRDMARPNQSSSFYLIFNTTIGNKKFVVPATAVLGPVADFSWDVPWRLWHPTVGEPVQFRDRSDEGEAEIVQHQWDFGDGNMTAGENPVYEYDYPGVYNVTLTIKDADGDVDSYVRQIRIHEPSSVTPLILIIAGVIAILVGAGIAYVIISRREKQRENRT